MLLIMHTDAKTNALAHCHTRNEPVFVTEYADDGTIEGQYNAYLVQTSNLPRVLQAIGKRWAMIYNPVYDRFDSLYGNGEQLRSFTTIEYTEQHCYVLDDEQ